MQNNKLVIAAAGSGKTTFLVREAEKNNQERVLITTFTQANAEEIKSKFTRGLPTNVTVQTWFSFLLEHGVRPFQGSMNDMLCDARIGFLLSEKKSGFRFEGKRGPVYWGESNFSKYYFTEDLKIYSDKVSKFIVECNKKTKGAVINRISNIFPYIFIDEVQDLAGWDLELLKLMLESRSRILLVGDPRQVTYSTNPGRKYSGYRNGLIKNFVEKECNKRNQLCEIDDTTLIMSHRNHKTICSFSSSLFPEYEECVPCKCGECQPIGVDHLGVFAIEPEQVPEYRAKYRPQVLKYQNSEYPDLNYGESKGLTFDRVLIYPTEKIRRYLKTGDLASIETVRAKFYVAVTRARYSVAIVSDGDDKCFADGILPYS